MRLHSFCGWRSVSGEVGSALVTMQRHSPGMAIHYAAAKFRGGIRYAAA